MARTFFGNAKKKVVLQGSPVFRDCTTFGSAAWLCEVY